MIVSKKQEAGPDTEAELTRSVDPGPAVPGPSSEAIEYNNCRLSVSSPLLPMNRFRKGLRLAAAGLSGLLICTNAKAAGAALTGVSAESGRPAEAALSGLRPEDSPAAGPALTGPDRNQSGSGADSGQKEWESAVIKRWGLNEEELPEQETAVRPEIPEDLVPYFQEWTAGAVSTYGQDLPPASSLWKYSSRVDALRSMVRETAESGLRHESRRIQGALKELASSAGSRSLSKMTDILQNAGHPDSLASDSSDSSDSHSGIFPFQRAEKELPAGSGVKVPFLSSDPDLKGPEAQNISSVARFLGEGADNIRLNDRDPDRLQNDQGETEADPYSRLTQMYTPLQWKVLPVPPGLSDFKIRFPSDVRKMETKHGRKLVPGLSNYVIVTDMSSGYPDILSEDSPVREAHGDQEPNYLLADREQDDPSGNGTQTFSAEKPEESTEQEAAEPQDPVADVSRRLVLIGDSRTVGMHMHVYSDENVYWSAADSMGYNWMVSKGVPAVEDRIEENTDVVFLMGVNDLGNVGKYADYMSQKAEEWKERGARTFFVSVNPVDDRRSPNAKNARIENFNSYMQDNLSDVHYIDSYSRIRRSFGSPDGIHFNGSTYQEIYRIIRFNVYRGWYEENGLWFYFDCGRPCTGWQYLDEKWQYFDGNGVRWITDGRVGEVCLAPFPKTDLLNPYEAVRHQDSQ